MKLNFIPALYLACCNPQSEIRNPQWKGACILPLNLIKQVQGARSKEKGKDDSCPIGRGD
jgi:hypothetical protein